MKRPVRHNDARVAFMVGLLVYDMVHKLHDVDTQAVDIDARTPSQPALLTVLT